MIIRKLKTQWKITIVATFILAGVFGLIFSQIVSLQNQTVPETVVSTLASVRDTKRKFLTQRCKNGKCYSVPSKTIDDDYAAYFIPSKKKITPINYDFVIQNEHVCSRRSPYIIALVPTSTGNSRERHAIRSTWGSLSRGKRWPNRKSKHDIKLVFLVGRSENNTVENLIRNESVHFGDIVQADFLDSYQNLTIKILIGIKWVSLFCSDSKFILKADDDTFVNMPFLMSKLESFENYDRLGIVLGHLNGDAAVNRYGRWRVSDTIYPFPHFPPYVFGNSYVLSSNIASRIFSASEYMPFIPVEDAYITGVLAKVIDAKLIDVSGFTFLLDAKPKFCEFVNDVKISGTNVSPLFMRFIWGKLESNRVECRN